jgi:hypothetical protein
MWHTVIRWSPAKVGMFITGAMMVFVTVLIKQRDWATLFFGTVAYVMLMVVYGTLALLESERPNGRAVMIERSNERAGWGPPC